MFPMSYEQAYRVQRSFQIKDRRMENAQNCDSGAENLTAIYEPIV
jgi:hypothetical protein